MKKSHLALAVGLAALASACSNLERSRDLNNPAVSAPTIAAQVCSNCHGLDGRAVSPNFPRLAGQQEAYVIAQLKAFKSYHRLDPAGFEYMWGISRFLTDDQIKGLAAYYAGQTAASPGPSANPALLAEGKEIFEKGVPDKKIPACSSCHGPNAQGKDNFPRLAHQHESYVVKQLMIFQQTEARVEAGVMKTVAHELSPQNMAAVAAYLQEFPGK